MKLSVKKILVPGVLALVASICSASAAESTTEQTHHLFKFDFDCDFSFPGSTYHADATVYSWVNGAEATLESLAENYQTNPKDHLEVTHNSSSIYNDGAVLYSEVDAVTITGANGVSPAVIVPRTSVLLDSEGMHYDALLEVYPGTQALHGSCWVKAQPAH